MFGFRKSPISKIFKQYSVDPEFSGSSSNPFDSDTESDKKQTLNPSRRTASEHTLVTPKKCPNPFDDDNDIRTSISSTHFSSKKSQKSNYYEPGGSKIQSVQELQDYAVYKAEETTKTVNGCLKIAEDIRVDASKTLTNLNHQGEQITRTHLVAANIDPDLSRGEKLLGSLGGMFSKTWKPKKTRPITGPIITRDELTKTMGNKTAQRERENLGLTGPKLCPASRITPSEQTPIFQKVQAEIAKQDDALVDLSNILGDLKSMAVDMGAEIDKQNKAIGHFDDDVAELNFRVKGANQRARRLLGK